MGQRLEKWAQMTIIKKLPKTDPNWENVQRQQSLYILRDRQHPIISELQFMPTYQFFRDGGVHKLCDRFDDILTWSQQVMKNF